MSRINPEKFSESKENESSEIEDLFGHGVKIPHIDNGDKIPIGGSIFADDMDTIMECNFQELDDFDESLENACQQLTEKKNLERINSWLQKADIDTDPELFAKLVAFRKVYDRQFKGKRDSQAANERMSLYKEGEEKQAKLSNVLEGGTQRCAEIAALAQYALQKGGIDTAYIGGDILRNREHEFAEEHSFILIKHDGEEYVYDPSNPVSTDQGKFPSLFKPKADFDDEIHEGKKRFVESQNIISDKEVYFGVSDGTNIIPERDLVESKKRK